MGIVGPRLLMVLVTLTMTAPAEAAVDASLAPTTERFANGGFDSGGTDGWKITQGHSELRTVPGRPAPSLALRVTDRHAMAFQTIEGIAGKVLVIRGSVKKHGRGITTQFYTRWIGDDRVKPKWEVQAYVGTDPEWQRFAFVVPAPVGAIAVDVGILHEGDGEVVIDDWSVGLR